MLRIVGGGGGSEGLLPSVASRRERLTLEGIVTVFLPVSCRCRRFAAAWGMKAWPSRLKGRTKGSTCEGLAYGGI